MKNRLGVVPLKTRQRRWACLVPIRPLRSVCLMATFQTPRISRFRFNRMPWPNPVYIWLIRILLWVRVTFPRLQLNIRCELALKHPKQTIRSKCSLITNLTMSSLWLYLAIAKSWLARRKAIIEEHLTLPISSVMADLPLWLLSWRSPSSWDRSLKPSPKSSVVLIPEGKRLSQLEHRKPSREWLRNSNHTLILR